MTLADWINGVAAVAASAAALFAALELRHSWRDRRDSRRAELNGVAVAWHPRERPNHPEPSGDALWVFEVNAQNPGPLPIRDVIVSLIFPIEVCRHHYDGTRDAPTRTLTMRQPVILGRGTRTWNRSLVIPFDKRDLLDGTTATIAFTPADGPRQTNFMDGRQPVIGSSA